MQQNPHPALGSLARACPRCQGAMDIFSSTAPQGKALHLDLCGRCRSVWFDAKEALQLPGLGWISLFRSLVGTAEPEYAAPQSGTLKCPRCKMPLEALHNQTRTGRFMLHRCGQCAGHLQTQVGMLAQWGYYRQALAADWAVLARENEGLLCQSCGGAIVTGARECGFCKTPAFVVDIKRLVLALQLPDIHAALSELAVPASAARMATWPCHACGHPLDPLREDVCGQCGHTVLVTRLADIQPALEAAEQLLRNPPPARRREVERAHSTKPTEAQARIDRMTSGFSAQGDRRALWIGCAYACFLFVLVALVQCMKM